MNEHWPPLGNEAGKEFRPSEQTVEVSVKPGVICTVPLNTRGEPPTSNIVSVWTCPGVPLNPRPAVEKYAAGGAKLVSSGLMNTASLTAIAS